MFNKSAINELNELTIKVEELTKQLDEIKSKVEVRDYNRHWRVSQTAPVNKVVNLILEHLDLGLVAIPAKEKSFVLTKNQSKD